MQSRLAHYQQPLYEPGKPVQMATMTMRAPSPYQPREISWEERQQINLPTRPRSQLERIELPPIRLAVPEIDLRPARESPRFRAEDGAPPIVEIRDGSSPPYANKRRIITPENERATEALDSPGPNSYRSSPRHQHLPNGQQNGLAVVYSNGEAYAAPSRGVSYHPEPIRSAQVFDPTRGEYRPNLSYPPRERGPYPDYPQSQYPPPQYDQAPPGYQPSAYIYGYDGRGKHFQEHASYPPSYHGGDVYGHGHHEPYANELGVVQGHDLKGPHRKRRGNLPKETTDKLRSWFVAHLHHPYPTEDEKQDLMMQTGLQMNQISNWFINARRRQLPTMINNARAESDARSARSHNDAANMQSGPEESDEDANYGEDYDSPNRSPVKGGGGGGKGEKL